MRDLGAVPTQIKSHATHVRDRRCVKYKVKCIIVDRKMIARRLLLVARYSCVCVVHILPTASSRTTTVNK
jgi:hypothetical protein